MRGACMNQSEMEAILKLYEAHFDPAAYQGAVDHFGSRFQDVRLGLQIEETAPRRFCLDSVFANNDERDISDYIDVAYLNPMVTPATVDLMRSGRLFRSEPYISRAEIKRSEFFDVYLRPRNRMDSAIGFNVFTGRGTTAMFTATIPEALSEDERTDLAASIDRIRPYVQRSFRMVRDLMQRTAVAQTGDIIDRVGTPVAVFDAAHQLIAQNGKAEAMFRSGGELSLSGRGTLAAREKKSSDHLYAAAGKVMAGSLPVGPVRIARPAQVPLILYFVPAGGGRLNPIIEPFKEGFPAYLLYVLDPEDVDPAPMDILTSALGLTPAEARLAESLHRGSTVREAAEQSSTAYATARNQLTAITRKLNLSRQSELTGLLARIMARVPR
ncbi:DNA-binding CsgD family transcriptional regulator [Amorphus sp. MBR-141]